MPAVSMKENHMTCIRVGDVAPTLTLPTDAGATWQLSAQRGRAWVLMFHRHLQ